MGKTEQMHIRVEPELKANAEAVLSQLGVRPTEFVRMALRQVVLQRGLPFAVRIPNAETIAALNEPTHDLKQFGSVDDLFADIEARRDPRTTEEGTE
ncbi:MAG: type II toxin-antitoxin system RelB/DinJ family antitoxin [Acidobacteria bacterium]|nr:type II toxin-antitoxin system RelB/DinJ family antitoxin [Acidobacteriota bacterium]